MGNKASRTEKEKDIALSNYVEDTIKNELTFKQSDEEVTSIKESVNRMVDCIMDEVVAIDERFDMLRKVPVGSNAEGMRIVNPDEFDFMIVLKSLSRSGVIEVRRQCKDLPSFAHAHIIDDAVREIWHDVCKDENLKSTPSSNMKDAFQSLVLRRGQNIGIRELFCERIKLAVKKLLDKRFTIPTTEGTLSLKDVGVQIHGPAITPLLNWHSICTKTDFEISVDLVPAIEINDINRLVDESDTYSLTVFEELKRTGRVHLTPAGRISPCKEGMCFQIACSETEVKLVKCLNSNHKKCYKILKDMFETRDEIGDQIIISYVLKTLIQKHANECTERKLSGACLMELLRTIVDNYLPYEFQRYISTKPQIISELGSVFFKAQDIFYFKEYKQSIRRFSSISKDLMKEVDRVREEYPIKEQPRGNTNFRIQVQQDSPSKKRLFLCAVSLPLSYIIPFLVVYLLDLCAGFHLPECVRSLSLHVCFILFSLLPSSLFYLHTWLLMLEIVIRSGRILLLAYAFWLDMPLSKRSFVSLYIRICLVFLITYECLEIDPSIYDYDILELELFIDLFLKNLIEYETSYRFVGVKTDVNLIWQWYVGRKEDEKLILQEHFFLTYFGVSMTFIYFLNLKFSHSCLRSKLFSKFIGLFVCSIWLLPYLLWGYPNYFLYYVSAYLMTFSFTCIVDLPAGIKASMRTVIVKLRKSKYFDRVYKACVIANSCLMIIQMILLTLEVLHWLCLIIGIY